MITNAHFRIELVGSSTCLWRYTVSATGAAFEVAPPAFEVDGQVIDAALTTPAPVGAPRVLPHGVSEHRWRGRFAGEPGLALEIVMRSDPASPVVRFRYRLVVDTPRRLTKRRGHDVLRYLGMTLPDYPTLTEVQLGEFLETVHSFHLSERAIAERAFESGLTAMGPILTASDGRHSVLLAYEHGSQVPDAFIHYELASGHRVDLTAIKGNYYDGQMVLPEQPFETVWLHLAATQGGDADLAAPYRSFLLAAQSPNAESRRPYIFYNTWNYQERNKWWHAATFLDSMHEDRILSEIDVAHRMGIEVFVIDTGWYEKTGDWRVNRQRFSDDLKVVKARLDGYGMKLGLWFSPREAAVSSRMLQDHRDCLMAWDGRIREPHPVWETEESQELCLVSRYWEAFADELIRLNREVGVTYFKWDAIHQYGCNAADHLHGTAANTPEERADCYAFELPLAMSRVVDRVCAACPEAIIDFDITEGHRAIGLSFLASGKYFLVNNGPYYRSLDDPEYAPGGGMGANVFVFPGSARARICRMPLDYDKWIPSVLFLTHYLPDPPLSSQMINLASLVLGQNGIWGDLLALSEAEIARFDLVLSKYKQVRDAITRAEPVRLGAVGGSPEIHEKIDATTGHGVVSIFSDVAGTYDYVTEHKVSDIWWASDGVTVSRTPAGRAHLEVSFEGAGAEMVLFGVR